MKRSFFPILVVLLFLVSCNPTTVKFSLVYNPEGPNPEIGRNMKRVLEDEFNVDFQLIEGVHTNANIDSLIAGKVDFALVENYIPYREGVNSAFSFYKEVLHVFYDKDLSPASFEELIYDKVVFVGRQGSPSYHMMMDLFSFYGLDQNRISISFNIVQSEVIVLLSTLLSEDELLGFRDFKLYSFDDIGTFGMGGSSVEGIALKYPRIDPFVIPRKTYGGFTNQPVVTLSVDVVMMVRAGLGNIAVTDLTKTMLRNRQTFAPIDPLLYDGMREDFDQSKLNFPLHEGARVFLDRDEPSFLERYAELGGVVFSIVIAIVGGLISLTKWQTQKKKDKVDEFYEELLVVKNAIPRISNIKEGLEKIKLVQGSQNRAFEMLISEELVANDSFRIYMELSKETIGELRGRMRTIKALAAKNS
ncbi:MAG: TAXI family TRAP transporter solute-binding subunit [Cyclobacteriaceae bacterium]